MAASRSPIALFALPLLTLCVLGLGALLEGSVDDVRFARVYIGPTDSAELRGRVELRAAREGVEVPLAVPEVELSVRSGARGVLRRVPVGSEGSVDFELPRPRGAGELILEVKEPGAERPLARGRVELGVARWRNAAVRRGGALRASGSAAGLVNFRLEPPVLAVPFAGRLMVTARAPLGAVRFEPEGLELGPLPLRLDAGESAVVELSPRSHAAALTLGVESGVLSVVLPVVPGSFGLERRGEELLVLSPVPRDAVWYTFVSQQERGRGGRLSLAPREDGTASATLPAAALAGSGLEPGDRYLVLASSADGRSPATVGLPLDGQESSFDALDAYALDGAPLAERSARAAATRRRLALAGLVTLGSLASLAVFASRVGAAEGSLARALAAAGLSRETRERSRLPLAAALVALAFAFSLAVMWILAR